MPIYLGGHSDDAQRIAAELADVYLVWGDTIEGIPAAHDMTETRQPVQPKPYDQPRPDAAPVRQQGV